MSPWTETAGTAALIASGFLFGLRISRLRDYWWLSSYLAPLVLIALIAVPRRILSMGFVEPFSWVAEQRSQFAILGFSLASMAGTIFTRIPRPRERVLFNVFIALVALHFCLLPYLEPAFHRAHFATLRTVVDARGVCHQSENWTCGPAAAVTLLRRMGLPAEEGELAILSRTSRSAGTPSRVLQQALLTRYGSLGLTCEYRLFGSIAELAAAGQVLAVIEYGILVDHWVPVMEITPTQVAVGDPLKGYRSYSHAEFDAIWRRTGLVVRRPGR